MDTGETIMKTTDKKYTKDELIARIYTSQKASSKLRGHEYPDYSLEELSVWIHEQPNFDELYSQWAESGFIRPMSPSVDRKDDYKGYTLDNLLRICTFEENRRRLYEDKKSGINNKISRGVNQLTKDGELISTYYSISQASRDTGINVSSICWTALGKYKTGGGFKWEYTE
jgi:hypothetical protein